MQKLIFIWTIFLASKITISSCDYTAAVVEYFPLTSANKNPNETVEENLKEYVRYIEQAHASNANIIVFPEYGLTGLNPHPPSFGIEIPGINEGPPFQDYWLEKISNAALGNEIYVVVNWVEKAKNGRNETIYYNTNVLFDKSGRIGAKYRKINVYKESMLTAGNPDENRAVFSTDFGVTFGMAITNDLLFYNPSRSMFDNSSVTDVILSSAWYSALPFYHSMSYGLAYAQANRVNLLASNLNSLKDGISGTGIYGLNGTVFTYYLPGTSTTKMLVATVKNTPVIDFATFGFDFNSDTKPSLADFETLRVFDSNRYKFQSLKLSNNSVYSENICFGSFCCQFNLTTGADVNSTEVYQLMAYTGPMRLSNDSLPSVRICTLLACQSPDPSSCGARTAKATSKFANITVTSDVPVNPKDFFQPLYLTADLLPVYNTTYDSRSDNGRTHLSLGTTKVEANVLAFGIYGSGGSYVSLSFSCFVVLVMAILNHLC